MALHAPVRGTGGNFTPHPKGQFRAVCVDIHDVGDVETVYDGKKKMTHKIDFYFFCGKWKEMDNGEHIPLLVRERFTFSFADSARMLPFVESWRGEPFESPKDRERFDIETLLHAGAQIQVVHKQSGENTYANISSIMALPEGVMPPEIPDGFVRMQDKTPRDGQRTPQQETVPPKRNPFNAEDDDGMEPLPF